MVERDVINAESCYQENGEEVRRQEAREEVRPQGRRQEGHPQRRSEESLREEDHRQKDGGEEDRGQEGRREKVGRQARASQAQEGQPDVRPFLGHAAGRLIGFVRSGVLADQARSPAVRPRPISLFVLCV